MSVDTSQRDEVICALAKDGYTTVEIAEEFDLSPRRVDQILLGAGVPRRTTRGQYAERREEMFRLAEQGWTLSQIAKKFDVPYRVCWGIFHGQGVKAPPSQRGRPRVYTEEDVLRALAEFLDSHSLGSSEGDYRKWSKRQRDRGKQIPTPGVAEKRFGGWTRALKRAQAYRKASK